MPFLIRLGKRLALTSTEGYVKLRKPPLDSLGVSGSNFFRFTLGPGDIPLSLNAQVKRPGDGLVAMPAMLTAVENTRGEVEAYERLLDGAMHGDAMLFVREDAVEAAWAVVEPILGNGRSVHQYETGSCGPRETS